MRMSDWSSDVCSSDLPPRCPVLDLDDLVVQRDAINCTYPIDQVVCQNRLKLNIQCLDAMKLSAVRSQNLQAFRAVLNYLIAPQFIDWRVRLFLRQDRDQV